ncbi:hypothetical protein EG68_11063 [Paragonimus skrjabini miyazakii]|uniref:Sperm microtubule inner protein 1 C-terminal domain-containing protein n=1 Tax=Paragonimus skrjabini miyazakii TaxID=59628 RepID=A0A8S9YEP1_9TREM|nr:hypothetical protein EG68_11063 [Paragonimus skrjabini miyazakii]
MARSFPADTRGQRALEELYEKELKTQIKWFLRNIKSKQDNPGKILSANEIMNTPLPTAAEVLPKHLLEPISSPTTDLMDSVKKEQVTITPLISEETDSKVPMDMCPAEPKVVHLLYDGISKEGKGRANYLKERNKTDVEDKYLYPVLSSMEYGWSQGRLIKEGAAAAQNNKRHGRVRIIEESFYRRNGIPIQHCAGML